MCYVPYIRSTGQPVPCGRCVVCFKRRASGWMFRLSKQNLLAETAYFVTLTYNKRCLPHTDDEYDLPTLNRKHVKDYCKRLRIAHDRAGYTAPIKYYFVGEYGKQSHRPHYHAIIFNARPGLIAAAWTLSVGHSKHNRVEAGRVHIDDVTPASICYVTKYLQKGRVVPAWERDPRAKEFANISKGLGLNYLTKAMVSYHRQDLSRSYITLEGGVKWAMPRYYRERIYDEQSRKVQAELIAAAKLADYEKCFLTSRMSRSEYAAQMEARHHEKMRLMLRHEDLTRVKL